MELIVHSLESMAAADGPGVRYGIFLAGCPLRCVYCHNPDTWDASNGQRYSIARLMEKIKRYRPYFKDKGGVTVSGGEPLLQAAAVAELADMLGREGINLAVDTSGSVINDDVKKLLSYRPLLLTDIKMPDEDRYRQYTGGSLQTNQRFLSLAQARGCDVWIRYVVVKGINDSINDIKQICRLAGGFDNVKKIELLPYHNMGRSKYEKLGLPYSLSDKNIPDSRQMQRLETAVKENFHR